MKVFLSYFYVFSAEKISTRNIFLTLQPVKPSIKYMSEVFVILIIAAYFAILFIISLITGRKKNTGNDAFFLGKKNSPWWIVAIGMLGTSVSGVSFVSVPGMVRALDFTYMQTVFGFFFGYMVVANVLLPLYYKLNLTTIYGYLKERFGRVSYKTGASFFLLSKLIGASARLYVVALILQNLVFDAWNVPFIATVCGIVILIWLYTFRSGIKTIVWTDTLQTLVLVGALILIIIQVVSQLDMNVNEITNTLIHSDKTRIFVFDDWHSKQNFFKQFFSGIFIVIVMTGLDQDMMQKNLTIKNLKDAKKNMYWGGFSFIPANFLFLILGALLLLLASQNNIQLPAVSDDILPMFAANYLGNTVFILFIIGIIAATFSSADSALTALTTSFYIDILEKNEETGGKITKSRIWIHLLIAALFVVVIMIFRAINNKSVIDAIYTIVSYTYGPLLGLYTFGLFTKRKANDNWVPFIAISSPVICWLVNFISTHYWNYAFGYELLMLNGLITFTGLMLSGCFKKNNSCSQ